MADLKLKYAHILKSECVLVGPGKVVRIACSCRPRPTSRPPWVNKISSLIYLQVGWIEREQLGIFTFVSCLQDGHSSTLSNLMESPASLIRSFSKQASQNTCKQLNTRGLHNLLLEQTKFTQIRQCSYMHMIFKNK